MTEAPPPPRPRKLGILAAGAAVVAVGIYACWPSPPFQEWPGSPAAAAPDGMLTAQIFFRQDRRAGFSLTSEAGDGFSSILRVRSARGESWEYDAKGTLSHYRPGQNPFTLQWTDIRNLQLSKDGVVLSIGYWLPTGVRLVYPDDIRKVVEPGILIPDPLKRRLASIGRGAAELAELQLVQIDGSFVGAAAKDIVCERGDVLLLLGPKFISHGQVISRGPIVCTGESYPMKPMASASWILLDDQSRGPDDIAATKVYVAPGAGTWWKGPTHPVPAK